MIEVDAMFQAVHVGHPVVTATDVLLSIIDLHDQLQAAGAALPNEVARWNRAGDILATYGLRGRPVTRTAAQLAVPAADREDDLTRLPTVGWPRPRTADRPPAYGRTALAALRQASHSARRRGHPYTGTTHILAALLSEPDGPASRLLHHLDIDPAAVRTEVDEELRDKPST
jgi:hypothetical protein